MDRSQHSLRQLLDSIESMRFAAIANVASDLSTFVDSLGQMSEFDDLVEQLTDASQRATVLNRLNELSTMEIDPRFEHPADVAMASYMLAIFLARPESGPLAARAVDEARNTWWTRHMSDALRNRLRATSNAARIASLAGEPRRSVGTGDRLYEPYPLKGVTIKKLEAVRDRDATARSAA